MLSSTERDARHDEHPPPVPHPRAARLPRRRRRLPQRGARHRGSQSTPATPGAPPTFGTGTGSGPAVSPATFAEAEKLMQVTMTAAERQQAADSWRRSLAPYLERRTGPRKVAIAPTDAPATLWNPMLPGIAAGPSRDRFVRSKADGAPLPSSDDAIAFAPVTQLSRWIESRQLTSERLTNIYLGRIERLDGKIRSVITLHEGPRARAREDRPTPRSPQASTAVRCTASRTA